MQSMLISRWRKTCIHLAVVIIICLNILSTWNCYTDISANEHVMTGYRTLSPDVEEGICQVLAHLWIESEIMAGSGSSAASSSSGSSSSTSSKKGGRSQFENKLGDFFKHQIETDTSMAYGDGFRAGNQAVLQYGLKRTLEHIRLTGTFPFWRGPWILTFWEKKSYIIYLIDCHPEFLYSQRNQLYKHSFQNPEINLERATKWSIDRWPALPIILYCGQTLERKQW